MVGHVASPAEAKGPFRLGGDFSSTSFGEAQSRSVCEGEAGKDKLDCRTGKVSCAGGSGADRVRENYQLHLASTSG